MVNAWPQIEQTYLAISVPSFLCDEVGLRTLEKCRRKPGKRNAWALVTPVSVLAQSARASELHAADRTLEWVGVDQGYAHLSP